MNTKHIIAITVFLALFLGACAPAPTPAPTMDVNPVYTAAAQTIEANLTATAQAIPPTVQPTATELPPTAAETFTPTAVFSLTLGPGTQGLLCDDAAYVTDINVPDGSIMTPGQEFLKTWKVRNTGACTWGAGYTLIYGGYNDKMDGAPAAITGSVIPGQEVEVSVQFKAPAKAGEYLSAWRMANPRGFAFGQFFFVKIVVR